MRYSRGNRFFSVFFFTCARSPLESFESHTHTHAHLTNNLYSMIHSNALYIENSKSQYYIRTNIGKCEAKAFSSARSLAFYGGTKSWNSAIPLDLSKPNKHIPVQDICVAYGIIFNFVEQIVQGYVCDLNSKECRLFNTCSFWLNECVDVQCLHEFKFSQITC